MLAQILNLLTLLAAMPLTKEECLNSAPSLSVVSNCPHTSLAWEEAAKRKDCESFSKRQCSDETTLVYHCLLNNWGNGTVEVCVKSINAMGFCVEYNLIEGRILRNTNKTCKSFSSGCPSHFTSNEIYKYKECYRLKEGPPNYEQHKATNDNDGINQKRASTAFNLSRVEIPQFIWGILFIVVFILIGRIMCKNSMKRRYLQKTRANLCGLKAKDSEYDKEAELYMVNIMQKR